ncbi:hypothetical protein ACWC5I_00815 [Kitasatospora sp. NPDC001574]
MDIDQQLDVVTAKITELQLAFVDCADDKTKRREIANQLKAARDQVTRLYELLPA